MVGRCEHKLASQRTKVRTFVPPGFDHPKPVVEFDLKAFALAFLPILGGIVVGYAFAIALVVI